VDEVGIAIVTNSPALQAQGGIPQRRGGNPRQANIDGFRQHVKAVQSHAGMRAAGAQEFIAPRSTVSTDNVDFAAGIVQGCGQVVEKVKQAVIEMTDLSRTVIAEVVVERGQRFRQVIVTAPINDAEPFVRVGATKAQPVFARGGSGGLPKWHGEQ
jgi:hypothetical protein